MFKNLRLRLTIWFVCLSAVAHITTTILTGVLFHNQLTAAIDSELAELVAEHLQNIDYTDGRLSLPMATRSFSAKPIKLLASIQLFDANGKFVQETGAPGLTIIYPRTTEIRLHGHYLRSLSRRVLDHGRLLGYLQVQLPTDARERAESDRLLMLVITFPVLIALLFVCGYYFTAVAIKPIEETFSILKEFMINAGHELNTPLSIAQAALDNLDRQGAKQADVLKKVSVIKLSLTRMRNLVDDMLLLAKLESDKATTRTFKVLPFHDLVRETLEHIQPLLEEHGIELSVESMDNVFVRGNMFQLQQMLTNLLQNAISYNKPDGTISVSLKLTDQNAQLVIADTGVGISEQDLPRIFDKFFRAESSRAAASGGSGLGLVIVKNVVEAHRGSIKVDSELNVGTKVIVSFPIVSQPINTHTIPTNS